MNDWVQSNCLQQIYTPGLTAPTPQTDTPSMLKKISTEQLRVGMYIDSFCGSWMDHPFWRTRFVVRHPQDVELAQRSAVRELWIDTSRGADVAPSVTVLEQAHTPEQAQASVLRELARAREVAPVSTADEITRAALLCKRAGAAVQSMLTEARMGRAISQDVARQVAEDIADSVTRNTGALISLARLKTTDDYSYMHSVAVCALMVALARQLGMPEEEARAAGLAGLLHDLGKTDLPPEVLNKPGKLTEQEFELVRQHPELGHQRLLQAQVSDLATLDVCLHHHERLDGTGYPKRLDASNISQMARMGAVCDIYDAVTSDRPYKAGWDPSMALARMSGWVDSHLDRQVFQAFVRTLGIYPIGSLVRLSSDKLAVVVDQSASLLKPIVKTVLSTRTNERLVPELIDLSAPHCRHRIVGREDPEHWKIGGLDEVWSGIARR